MMRTVSLLTEEWRSYELGLVGLLRLVVPFVLAVGAMASMDYMSRLVTTESFVFNEAALESSFDTVQKILAEPVPDRGQLETMFLAYASFFDVDPKMLRHIAFCESRFDPKATNGRHSGLYQFNPPTWVATRTRMGLDTDPALRFDAEEAIKTAAFKINNSGTGAWVVCSRSFFIRS